MESPDNQNNMNQVCTESRCTDGDAEKKIVCSKCKRAVHFVCTKLPTYQLKLFYTKNYRGYICISCVKVPEEFQQVFNKQEERLFEKCQREVEACENIIKVQRENEEKLISGIKKLKSQKEYDDRSKDVTKLIEDKFDQLEKKLTSKLSTFCSINSRVDKNDKSTNANSFAAALKNQNVIPDFQKILRKERMTEREEEHQQDLRQKNFMVFGAEETREVSDEEFIKDLIKDVGVDAKVKFFTRIGSQTTNKSRPIKVVLETAHQRWLIMHSLKNLKGKKSYDGISIAEDFTLFERGMIKEWTGKAKARNEKEASDSKYVWRVRGSPSKGLYMKRLEKRWPLSTD